jgi:hypothetical protein
VRGGRVAMADHVITPEMAATLYVEAIERRELPAWIVFQDEPDYPGKRLKGAEWLSGGTPSCSTSPSAALTGKTRRTGKRRFDATTDLTHRAFMGCLSDGNDSLVAWPTPRRLFCVPAETALPDKRRIACLR